MVTEVSGFAEAFTPRVVTDLLSEVASPAAWSVHYVVAGPKAPVSVGASFDARMTVEVRTYTFPAMPSLAELAALQRPQDTVAVAVTQADGTAGAVSLTGATGQLLDGRAVAPVGPPHRSRYHDRARRLLGIPALGPSSSAGPVAARWWQCLVAETGLNADTVSLRPDLVLGAYARQLARSDHADPSDPRTVAAVLRELLVVGENPQQPVDRTGVALLAAEGCDALLLLYRLAVRPVLQAGGEVCATDHELAFLDGPSCAWELYGVPPTAPALSVELPPGAAAAIDALRAVPPGED